MFTETRGVIFEQILTTLVHEKVCDRIIAIGATIHHVKILQDFFENAEFYEADGEFRDIPLRTFVRKKYLTTANGFVAESLLDHDIVQVLHEHNPTGKPTLIFCKTRQSSETCARYLYSISNGANKPYNKKSSSLEDIVSKGFGYHHAGLNIKEREFVENQFLNGGISVLCCTTTLCMGVNLPAFLVIVKHVAGGVWKGDELDDSTLVQMTGRADRKMGDDDNFDEYAVAVLLTTDIKRESFFQNDNDHDDSGKQTPCMIDAKIAYGAILNWFHVLEVSRNDRCRKQRGEILSFLKSTLSYKYMQKMDSESDGNTDCSMKDSSEKAGETPQTHAKLIPPWLKQIGELINTEVLSRKTSFENKTHFEISSVGRAFLNEHLSYPTIKKLLNSYQQLSTEVQQVTEKSAMGWFCTNIAEILKVDGRINEAKNVEVKAQLGPINKSKMSKLRFPICSKKTGNKIVPKEPCDIVSVVLEAGLVPGHTCLQSEEWVKFHQTVKAAAHIFCNVFEAMLVFYGPLEIPMILLVNIIQLVQTARAGVWHNENSPIILKQLFTNGTMQQLSDLYTTGFNTLNKLGEFRNLIFETFKVRVNAPPELNIFCDFDQFNDNISINTKVGKSRFVQNFVFFIQISQGSGA